MKQKDAWVTVSEAAVALRLPHQNVHRLVQLGQLRAERVGSRWRVWQRDVARLARERAADGEKDATSQRTAR